MAGRFSTHRVAAPALVPAIEEALAETVSVTGLSEPAPAPAPEPPPAPPAANPLLSDKLLDAKVRLHRRLIEEINLSALEKLPEEEMRSHIQGLVSQYVLTERLALNTQELNDFVLEILDEMTGLGPLEPLLKDPTVNDILINGHECVYVERLGILEPTGVRFKDEAHLLRIINKIVSAVGRRVDESHPMCDARLLDGSRVNVAVRPVAIDGPLMSIRKFSKKPFNLNKLVDVGALRPQMAELLSAAVRARITLIISGGTGLLRLNGFLENLRIETSGPSIATGRTATLTREPSSRRASHIGCDSSTRRPTAETILLMMRSRCDSSLKRTPVGSRMPPRST